MALTVELMARLSSYVMAGQEVERFIKDSKIPAEDVQETKTFWRATKIEYDNMAPGESMMVPNEWS